MSYRDANHLKSTFQRELWSEAGTWLLEDMAGQHLFEVVRTRYVGSGSDFYWIGI